MARQIGRLTVAAVAQAKTRGYLSDGGGLYLAVSPAGAKSWVFRFRMGKRLREMGLGALHTVPLAKARDAARACREQLVVGLDPIEHRQATRANARLQEAARVMTFRAVAEAYMASRREKWTNAKHADQWAHTLRDYAYPVFGHLPVAAVDTGLVLQAVEPIWSAKKETASRVRGRIETVLDYAAAKGYRAGDNPARWRGHMEHLLPNLLTDTNHHAALPWCEAPAFLGLLRQREGLAARALELVILTAARTTEVLGARWDEFDLDNAVWTIPAARMKAKREHRVPLSPAAVALLKALPRLNEFAFPGADGGHLSKMTMLLTLKRMGRDDLTVHGFRSTFRDWAGEAGYPDDVAEAALAHITRTKTQAAYQRGDLFERRRVLMEAWSEFVK